MQINTLVDDIYTMVQSNGWFTEDIAADLGNQVARRLREHFNYGDRKPTLRLSRMGPTCPHALWQSIHHPELAVPLRSPVKLMLSFGHMLEAQAICLSKLAGHSVTGEQDELVVDDIVGHRDCVIDGCIVDVKSTTSYGFARFKERTIGQEGADLFGYLDQLDGYLLGSASDPLVTVKDRAYILAIDKQLGKMVLYEHRLRENHIRRRIKDHKEIVGRSSPPQCTCETKLIGKSGNIGLDTKASYSPFKYSCFPGLRTFLYAEGPVFLTHVERKPDVPEVDREGNIIYR